MPVANSASSHCRRRGKTWRKKLRRVAGPKPRHRKPAGVSAATKSNPHIETVVLNASARWSWLEVRHRQRGWRTEKMRPGAVQDQWLATCLGSATCPLAQGWIPDWSADSHVRVFLASDQVLADKAVRAPVPALLESALPTCQVFPDFPLTKPISCENDLPKTGLTARPLLVWPPDHNNWPRSAQWHA